ncbi:hypothetical protein [Methanobrevibacter arboriphilus]|uniref:hypothetical protein n=1 Tax=Methanobrevibacter arboriphilus TaxID=39441 RepID=UPI000ABAD3B5|nr:hypothetical protein [Methanobrevibacter arboriphilus]
MEIMSLTYWIIFFILIVGIFIVFFKMFEKSKPTVENIVIIAILIAIAALGTLPTAAIPGVQAASFIIIMTGIVFGKKNRIRDWCFNTYSNRTIFRIRILDCFTNGWLGAYGF